MKKPRWKNEKITNDLFCDFVCSRLSTTIFERKVFKSSPTKKLDDTKFCVYEGKEYSKGSVIKAEGVNLKCGTYSSDVFDKTLSWGK